MNETRNGQVKTVEQLLAHGARVDIANNVQKTEKDGFTSLHWAASNGHTVIVKVLLDHGAPVDTVNANRDTPLHLAAENAKVEFVHENDPSVNSMKKVFEDVPCFQT
ncbi:unnamed protein product [Aphanomyces euteiches]